MKEEEAILLPKKEHHKKKVVDKTRRYLALIVVGILTGGYSILEIVVSRWLSSVSLLSDGIHNLSDVISFMALGSKLETWQRTLFGND